MASPVWMSFVPTSVAVLVSAVTLPVALSLPVEGFTVNVEIRLTFDDHGLCVASSLDGNRSIGARHKGQRRQAG